MIYPLRPLVIGPVPPPIGGGIAKGDRDNPEYFVTRPNVQLRFVDTAVRWRRQTNHSLAVPA